MSPRRARTARRLAWLALVAVVVGSLAFATVNTDRSPQTPDERSYAIKKTTLCPVCQGQNILESNAAIAASMRVAIDDMVAAGDTDDEIRSQLAADFGGEVNATPPGSGLGSVVWMIPIFVVLVGGGGLWLAMDRWSTEERRVGRRDRELVEAALRRRRGE